IHLEDRRVTDAELGALVTHADCILAPYHRHVGSSGVLLWAARENKSVITQDDGLLARFVRDYHLGLTVDTMLPESLARALEQVANTESIQHIDPTVSEKFLRGRTPDRFAAAVVDATLESAKEAVAQCEIDAASLSMITRPTPNLRTE